MRLLDIFSGIGGFSLGLERAGFKTVALCEIDLYCRQVLAKRWPLVPCYKDIRELTAASLARNGISIDAIAGGFPCQDISLAGSGGGINGDRSGLWSEYRRLIGELRPRYAIVENVAALLSRGMDQVLGDLAALGYDAEWHCIPASAVGAPHRRDRIWIIAHPRGEQHESNSSAIRRAISEELLKAHPDSWWDKTERLGSGEWAPSQRDWWRTEPNVGRVANGIPSRVDRLKALGNAVVPQIPEIIGRAIINV